MSLDHDRIRIAQIKKRGQTDKQTDKQNSLIYNSKIREEAIWTYGTDFAIQGEEAI